MRTPLRFAVMLTIVASLLDAAVAAPPAAPSTLPATRKAGTDVPPPLQKLHARALAELKLPDDSARRVSAILADYREEIAAWERRHAGELAELKPKLKMFHGPRDPEQMAEVKAAFGRYRELLNAREAKGARLLARLKEVLTDEQFAKAVAVLTGRDRRGASEPTNKFHYLTKLKLSPEQTARIKAIMDEANRPPQAARKAAPMGADRQREIWNRILTEVLTPENQAKLTDLMQMDSHRRMVLAMLRGIELTPEQSAKVDDLWRQAYAQAKSQPSLKFSIYQQARQIVVEKILTPEQREQMNERPAMRAGGMGYHGPAGTGAPVSAEKRP